LEQRNEGEGGNRRSYDDFQQGETSLAAASTACGKSGEHFGVSAHR
jgi:hypothetical protein